VNKTPEAKIKALIQESNTTKPTRKRPQKQPQIKIVNCNIIVGAQGGQISLPAHWLKQ
jgi:hypothetical protein